MDMENIKNSIDEAITKYCAYRLPCGLCSRTYVKCPYATNNFEITCTTTDVKIESNTDKHTT